MSYCGQILGLEIIVSDLLVMEKIGLGVCNIRRRFLLRRRIEIYQNRGKMPPKRSRTTRATRAAAASAAAAAAAVEDTTAPEEVVAPNVPTEEHVDGANDQNGKVEDPTPTTTAQPIPTGTQVNGKPAAPKSAAQKKREKRKQKRREGSVMSEVSDTESVLPRGRSYANTR